MKLYDVAMPAPNPRRVRIFLAEKGMSLPLEPVALMKREHKSPEFRAKNSLGQVPVLELDDGTHIRKRFDLSLSGSPASNATTFRHHTVRGRPDRHVDTPDRIHCHGPHRQCLASCG